MAERTTGHGIAAGVGKLGAFLGVFFFPLLKGALGLSGTLLFCAAIGLAGALLTLVLPELSGQSLEAATTPAAEGDGIPAAAPPEAVAVAT